MHLRAKSAKSWHSAWREPYKFPLRNDDGTSLENSSQSSDASHRRARHARSAVRLIIILKFRIIRIGISYATTATALLFSDNAR